MQSSLKTSQSHRLPRLCTSQNRREYKSGAVYDGQFEGIKKSGKGIFKWPNGAYYDGEYVDNTRHGGGRQCWTDGSFYEGSFARDLRHGRGKLVWADGESYEGSFYRDRKHGKGVYAWPDGTKFDGHFEHDKKEGFGVFTFSTGNRFEGVYQRDMRDGPGITTYIVNGRQDVGLWHEEKLVKLCSVMESAFLFQHYSDYNVNAGNNLSGKVRRANSAWESVRNSPSQDIDGGNHEGCSNILTQVPDCFAYLDIIEGIRGDRSTKGPIEYASEEFLRSAAAGDCIKVEELMQSGLVHVDVADKTGYTALLAAAVNCHRDVINCLLDNGANVNKLNDEGLSVLAACHVLFYTKYTWKDNIAENIPEENLFNCIQEDPQKGVYIHRNSRSKYVSSTGDSLPSDMREEIENLDHKTEENNNYNRNLSLPPNGLNFWMSELNSNNPRSKVENQIPLEYDLTTKENKLCAISSETEGVYQDDGTLRRNGLTKAVAASLEHSNHDQVSWNTLDKHESGNLSPSHEFVPTDVAKIGNTGLRPDIALFSILSVVSSTRDVSDLEDVQSENSVEQNKQVLLALQRRPHLEATVRLLLKRGADPNASSLPMPVLFFAVKAADAPAVEILLQKGADTSAKLCHEKLGIAPLHIAVALPDTAGIEITELLLKSGANASIRDSAFGDHDENGRTPLHIACSREDNDKDACAVVRLLLEYGANPDLLCEGHSALSLAISSGNDLAVGTLLEHKANPSLKLSRGVGSALCAATSFAAERRRSHNGRIRLINKLMRAGANILAPIIVSSKYPPGTVLDYAYSVFNQDRKIAHTPYHALTACERECYNARREMLDHLGDLLRTQVLKKEMELIEKQLAQMDQETDLESKSPGGVNTPWGILKSPLDRRCNSNNGETELAADKEQPVPPLGGTSRVSFRLDNDVQGDEHEHDVEAEADREVEAITGSERMSPVDAVKMTGSRLGTLTRLETEQGQATTSNSTRSFSRLEPTPVASSQGRDTNCGLRIAVVKAADHMSISALATQALKQRKQVMRNRFRYCYECGRSIGVRLSPCTRCKEVFYCSKSCKLKAWNARHRDECVRITDGNKTASSRGADSPTPTTDPDVPPCSAVPSQKKIHGRGANPGGRRSQRDIAKKTSSPSRASRRKQKT